MGKSVKIRLAELDYRLYHRVNEWKPKEERRERVAVVKRLTKAPRRK